MIRPKKPASAADVSSHYDDLDWFYQDAWGRQLHHGLWENGTESTTEAVAKLRNVIAEGVGLPRGAKVCDIGCGYGEAGILWARDYGWNVAGYTLSEKQQRFASRSAEDLGQGVPRPEFVQGDWLENELEDSSMDAVLSIECLSHVGEKQKFFEEIERVLKPGGRLSLSAWTAKTLPSSWQRRILEAICEGGRFPSLLSAKELHSHAEAAGLPVERLEQVGPQVKKTWRVIFWRLLCRLATHRAYRQFLLEDARSRWSRTLTIVRVWLAFEAGILDYAILRARKEQSE